MKKNFKAGNAAVSSKKLKFVKYFVANVMIAAVVVSLIAFSYASNNRLVSSNSPVYKGGGQKVSLMINVYWGTEYIEEMLNILANNKARTTFFVGGSWAASNTEMLKKIRDGGHEIGNHGYFHKDHKKLGEQANHDEIFATHALVKKLLGLDMTLFAPPSGAFSKLTLVEAEKLGYTTVMWTRDTIDWRDKDASLIYKRATKKLSGGDLILMHPTAETVKALDMIIKTALENGLVVCPVSEVIEIKND